MGRLGDATSAPTGSSGCARLCVGEEAFVDPRTFTLEGRPVRKLRQSVHRVERRGWKIAASTTGASSTPISSARSTQLEWRRWRARRRRLHGFAMGMGTLRVRRCAPTISTCSRAHPSGELGAVMRFITHCGKLSLDTMRRVGETPNGLNEALVCRALEAARGRGVRQGEPQLRGPRAPRSRAQPSSNRAGATLTRLAVAPLRPPLPDGAARALQREVLAASGVRAISSTSRAPACRAPSSACSRPRDTCPSREPVARLAAARDGSRWPRARGRARRRANGAG